MVKKRVIFAAALFSLFLASFASAISLQVQADAVSDVVIKEMDNAAVFDMTITNLGTAGEFEIYSLVGVDFSPDTITLGSGETKTIRVELKPDASVKKSAGYYTFVYKIKDFLDEKQEEKITIRLVSLEDALYIYTDNIFPDSQKINLYAENREKFNFPEVKAKFSSAFFRIEKTFALGPLETKTIGISLEKESIKSLVAGPYLLSSDITAGTAHDVLDSTIKFVEKEGISTAETHEGWLIKRYEIEKRNIGNIAASTEVIITHNFLSAMFTNFNIPYYKKESRGSGVSYIWQQQLAPGESLKVVAKTNWLVFIIILVALALIIWLIRVRMITDLVLRKKVNFVKTKTGEFALKVTIIARARKFIENLAIIDKMPPMVKVYERFGSIAPDMVDEKNRRIKWNIDSLREHEERIFSYIVYSKIGIFGKFELPPAEAIYERHGRVREIESNRVFFLSEKRR